MTTASRSPFRFAWWALAALSALLTLVLVVATLALPGWVTGRGAQLAGEQLGRAVRVDEAQFQPWRLALVLQGVQVAGAAPAAPPLLTLDRLDVALSLRSLLRGRAVVESLTLDRPQLRLARTAVGRYDIDDILQRLAARPGDAEASEPEFAVYNIQLRDGRVEFDDRPVQRRHTLAGLQLALPFLSTLPADVAVKLQPQLSGTLDGVPFDSRAEALPFAEAQAARLSFKLTGLDLAPLAAYLPDSLPARLAGGRLDVDLALDFAERPRQSPDVKLSGQLQLSELAIEHRDGQPLLRVQTLRLPLADVQPLRRQAVLGDVLIRTPDLRWRALPAGQGAAPGAPSAPWQLRWAALDVSDGRFADAALALDAIGLKAGPGSWPLKAPVNLQGELQWQQARLVARARLSPEQLQLDATLDRLSLEPLARWMPLPSGARLGARLSAAVGVTVADPLGAGAAERLQVTLGQLQLADLRLALPGAPRLLTLAALRLDDARVDIAQRQLALGQLVLDRPQLDLAREADGRLNLLPLLTGGGAPAAGAPWQLRVAGLQVERGALHWQDLAVPAALPAVRLAVEPLKLKTGPISWPAQGPIAVELAAQLAPVDSRGQAVADDAGSLQASGRLSMAPLSLKGAVQARALPLQLFNAYLDPSLGLQLQRAELGGSTAVEATQQADGQWAATVAGQARVGPLALLQTRVIEGQRVVGEDLLSWQALQLDGLQLALSPGAPLRVAVKDAQLDDAYARLIINEQGRFNLRDLRPAEAARGASAPSLPGAPAWAASGAAAAVSAPAPEFSAERIQVNRGVVDFTDRLVRPSYSARLSELQGSLGAFSSTGTAMAPLTVRGRIAGTGQLEIDGQLKPGAPLAMDIAANATDIELAPLSPYAAKYAGYAIERGKLSTRLRYQVEPGGQLVASNQIILNQLTFGDRVESPDATSLPVRFALALLKDRDGVVEVNLPVSGSLNDPQFSVGGLIWRLFVNLIGKALTSPFALFSGSDSPEEAHVAFQPGRVELAAVDQLDRIARLLVDRPGVQLTLTGWAGIAAEGASLREQKLDRALRAENAPTPEAALKRLYKAAKLPNKPKNLLGLAKDLPPEQMRGLLLGSYTVDDEALRQLAVARATAVHDALLARGAPNARVFLAAPKLCDQACDETWRPHVELSLGAH